MPTLKEGFKNIGCFFKTALSLSSHFPVFFSKNQFDELNNNGQPIPPEKRKHMDLVQESLLYFFFILGSPVLFPIIFIDPKKAAPFVRQFAGIEGEEAYLKIITSPQHHEDTIQ